MADDLWYYQALGDEIGPISAAQLKQLASGGGIQSDTLLRKGGQGAWTRADQFRGLFPSKATPPPQKSPPPIASALAPDTRSPDTKPPERPSTRRRGGVVAIKKPERSYGLLRLLMRICTYLSALTFAFGLFRIVFLPFYADVVKVSWFSVNRNFAGVEFVGKSSRDLRLACFALGDPLW